jgi:hypothetical protein
MCLLNSYEGEHEKSNRQTSATKFKGYNCFTLWFLIRAISGCFLYYNIHNLIRHHNNFLYRVALYPLFSIFTCQYFFLYLLLG